MSIFVLQYVTNTYGTFEFDDINIKLFKSAEDAADAVLQIAKNEYPDEDPEIFEDIEACDDFMIRLLDDDKPALMYEITEKSLDI